MQEVIDRNWRLWARLVAVCMRNGMEVNYFGKNGVIVQEPHGENPRVITVQLNDVLRQINNENYFMPRSQDDIRNYFFDGRLT